MVCNILGLTVCDKKKDYMTYTLEFIFLFELECGLNQVCHVKGFCTCADGFESIGFDRCKGK